jgi:glycosyltransferase involved in cell wall biosynthesis
MTFTIEALGLTSGGGKAGLMQLVPALARHTEHRFVVIVADLPEFASLARPNLKLIVSAKPRSLVGREIHLQRTVPRVCGTERAHALLCLGNFPPRYSPVPVVVLLHNARYVSKDRAAQSHCSVRERLVTWYGRRTLQRPPRGVRLVLQTELMRRLLLESYPHLTSRVVVIPDRDGLAPELTVGASLERNHVRANDRGDGLAKAPFTFLCVANYYPHKNLEALVDACRLLQTENRAIRCLLTIDVAQHPRARRLLEKIGAQKLSHLLINLGQLSQEQVIQAYRCADAFILPSLLESFGRTYREAMRFGLPILTADRDFARDACGDAAIYFDPLRPLNIAQRMTEIMESRELRERLSQAGLRRAAEAPSWDEIAAQFIRLLENAGTRRSELGVRSGLPAASPAPIRFW